MRVKVVGKLRHTGVSKNTGKPYDLGELHYTAPAHSVIGEAADGFEEHNYGKAVFNMALVIFWGLALILGTALLISLARRNMPYVIIGGFLAAGLYSAILKLTGEDIGMDLPAQKPTSTDYQVVLETLRPAIAEVAQTLGLAPVYGHSDMMADPEEQILPWGKVWRLKYKALKKSASTPIDEGLCQRIIQAWTVLERDNPSGFSAVRFQRGSSFVPVIQIDEIKDGDAYINIFAVISSDAYFKQKAEWLNRRNLLAIENDFDDTDF